MSQSIQVNGQTINYPETGDTNWSDDATNFAIQTSAALGKIGLSSGTSVDITQTLDVTGNTTLDANLSVGGNLTVNGNTQLGNANTDSIGVTGIVNIDSGVLYVDPVNNRVGINDTTPSEALDVTGNVAITGNETVGGTLGVTGDVAINTNKFNIAASSGNTTIAGTLGVTGNTTVDGVIYADDNTTANTPVISFTGNTNTGIGRSAANTIDFITNGNSRFRIESTGQISAVYPSGSTLYPGYLCRAWVNFNGSTVTNPASTTGIRGSGNISSILDNGIGNYTINIDIDMADTNYCVVNSVSSSAPTSTNNANHININSSNYNVGSFTVGILRDNGGGVNDTDPSIIGLAVFR